MSLKRNIAVSYGTQIYVTVIGLVILPMYLKYMGAEAYGLVGFFTMLQAWFSLLDIGLTPTIARETARFRGGATDAIHYLLLFRALQIIFWICGFVGGGVLFLNTDWLASKWLGENSLPLNQVVYALQVISLSVALRWMCGLYKGVISGSEKIQWMSGFNAAIATLRYVGALLVLVFISSSVVAFFSYQLLVALTEFSVLIFKAKSLMPRTPQGIKMGWSFHALFKPISDVLKFSLSIAVTSSIWILVTQTDKLILSNILPLAEYGYFTLAVLAASGVTAVSGPISSALLPRMTKLEAQGELAQLITIYRLATQMIVAISATTSLILGFFSELILQAWTGSEAVAAHVSNILILYSIGNAILVLNAFPYYLQYAKGDLRLHVKGNAIFVIAFLPLVCWAANIYGGLGAGYAWLLSNLLYFLLWVPKIHRALAPGLQMQWVYVDVVKPFLVVFSILSVFKYSFPDLKSNYLGVSALIVYGLISVLGVVFSIKSLRVKFLSSLGAAS